MKGKKGQVDLGDGPGLREGWMIFSVSLATFMSSLDATIVYIALPTIQRFFGVGLGEVTWVVVGYMLPLACLLLLFGRLGDLLGFRRIFLSGFALFTVASVLCAFSNSIWTLVGCRGLQAVGSAMMASMSFAILGDVIPKDRRGKAFGWLNVSASLALCLGPPLGGFLAEHLGWRTIFLVNVPVGLLGVLLGVLFLPAGHKRENGGGFDAPGALLLLFWLVSLLLVIQYWPKLGWASPLVSAGGVCFLLFFPLFIWWEARASRPLLELNLFLRKNFFSANAAGFLFFLVVSGSSYILPFFLEIGRGLSADQAGMMLTLPSAMIVLSGVFIGKLSDRLGARLLGILGMAGLIATFAMLAFFSGQMTLWAVGGTFALLGLSAGFFVIPNSGLLMGLAEKNEQGLVSGLMNTVRRTGGMVGVAVFGSLLGLCQHSSRADGGGVNGNIPPDKALLAFSDVSLLAVTAAAAGLVFVLFYRPK